MPEHTITADCVWRNWLGGTVDGLPFAAKICDVNSPDGIDNGRVLKLFLYAEDGEQEIAACKRSWSIYPSGSCKASMDALLAYCASLPHAESWQKGRNDPNLCQEMFGLLPNIQALRCQLALYECDMDMVERWMKSAPDEDREFCLLERYRYLTKVRCYLANGEYTYEKI